MQLDLLDHSDRYNFEDIKIKDGSSRRIETSKNRHISATI